MSAHLKTLSSLALAQQLGVETVVMNAPTRILQSPALVAQLSEAGGLGVICTFGMTPEGLREFVKAVRARTDRPFAIALAIPSKRVELSRAYDEAVLEALSELGAHLDLDLKAIYTSSPTEDAAFEALFDCALELAPATMISCFGGFREPHAERLEATHILNMGVVTSLREAKVLRFAGCDAIVAQGVEAGGPSMAFESKTTQRLGLMPLLSQCQRLGELPVVAWGGISQPNEVQALGALGISGVMLEGPLLMLEEALLPSETRYLLEMGNLDHTIEVMGFYGVPTRVLRTVYSENLPSEEAVTPLSYSLKRVFWAIHDRARERGISPLTEVAIGHEIGQLQVKNMYEIVSNMAQKLLNLSKEP